MKEKNTSSCCGSDCCADESQMTSTMEKSDEQIKQSVRRKYAAVALSKEALGCCSEDSYRAGEHEINFVGDSYDKLDGYQEDADLNLGCGLPTEFARIQPGHTVVDLGSGAGNDAFIARQETGPNGKVIGIDFTKEMVNRARENAQKLNFDNVVFHMGDIEDIPLESNTVDVVVSNCVFNLVPDKPKAFSETYRILKPGGHFSISDIVLVGEIPAALKHEAELYAGCVAGAIDKKDYLRMIEEAGFGALEIQKDREIKLPEETLNHLLTPEKKALFDNSEVGIFSITVFGKKPG